MTAAQQLKKQLASAPAGHPMIKVIQALLETRNGEMLNSVFGNDVEADLRYFMKRLTQLINGEEVVSLNHQDVWTFDGATGTRRVR